LTIGGQPVSSTGDIIDTSDTEKGFICKNSDQIKGRCSDYQVRFLCPTDFCPPPPGCWTDWFDRDNSSDTGDFEILIELRKENPGKICNNPLQIHVLTIGGQPVSSTGDIIDTSDTEKGFICKNSDQKKGRCSDYKVRFLCPIDFCAPPPGCWTDWFDRDNPSDKGDFEILINLRKENPGKICNNPLQIQVLTTGWLPVSSTGDIIDTSDTEKGFICKHSDQIKGRCSDYQVRFECPIDFCPPSQRCMTDWFNRDDSTGKGDFEILIELRKENPGKICNNPLQIQVLTTGGNLSRPLETSLTRLTQRKDSSVKTLIRQKADVLIIKFASCVLSTSALHLQVIIHY
uniref:WxxW domain-containing protein n=1 Tax=Neogobius melanostomus TaxID=47308 RepID=A0A8C6WIJ6_9GOBI